MKKTVSIRPRVRPMLLLGSALLFAGALLASGAARSQTVDPTDLEELVAPIALYPDDVLGIILPASTFPLDIVRAARFLDELEQDPTLEPDESWDESVIALLNYPEVLRMMDEDLDWTWALGEAVLTDEEAVLAAAQDFRRLALAAGNLPSDDKQVVTETEGVIEIAPTDPEVVYIPVYEPREVVVYQPAPVYHYYPVAYPVYYYPYPSRYYFGSSFFWGVTSYFSIGWHSHHLHVHHHSHRAHPYYLNSYYYAPYFYRNNVVITASTSNYTNIWRPSTRRSGDRPRTLTVEGRDSIARAARTTTVESQPGVTRTTIGSSRNPDRLTDTNTRRSVPSSSSSSARIRGISPTGSATATTNPRARESTPAPGTSSTLSTRTRTITTRSTAPRTTTTVRPSTTTPRMTTRTTTVTSTPAARSSSSSIAGVARSAPTPAPRAQAPAPRAQAPSPVPRAQAAAPRAQAATRSTPSAGASRPSIRGIRR